MVNQYTNGLGFARLRDHFDIGGFAMPECALRRQKIFAIGLIGMVQGRIVSISRGSPPPEER